MFTRFYSCIVINCNNRVHTGGKNQSNKIYTNTHLCVAYLPMGYTTHTYVQVIVGQYW